MLSPGRKARVARAIDLLELAPVRCAVWLEREDGRVIIDRPRPPIDGLTGLFRRVGWMMAPRRIRLDEIGSFAWRRLDGTTKMRTLALAMRDAFPDSCDQLEERLGEYIRSMRRLQLISFPELDAPTS
jgi:hypothetical protein